MKPICVRAEPSGAYVRLRWVCPLTGGRKSENLGLKSELSRKQIKDAAALKSAELTADPALASRGRMSIAQWRERHLGTVGLADSSLDELAFTFNRLEEYFGADFRLPKLDASRARDFVRWLEGTQYHGKTVSTATVRKHVRNCKSICARAVKERALTGLVENPFLDEKSAVPKVTKDWATVGDAEMEKIFDSCPDIGWRCMFALCRYAGLRQQEAWRLTWADIHWDDPARLQVLVPEDEHGNSQDEDTKNQYRVVPITAQVYPMLREAFESGAVEGPCRNLPNDKRRISHLAARIVARAGLLYRKPLHTLRKNLQTEWEKIIGRERTCELLGNSPAVADKHYIAPATMEDLKRLAAASGPA